MMKKSPESNAIPTSTFVGEPGDEVPLWDQWLNGDISIDKLPEKERAVAQEMLDKFGEDAE
jgi:hypothetical protein